MSILSVQKASAQDPVLFSIDGEDVHLSEYKYVYEKSNGVKADYSPSSTDEFMDLYTKFKLKVIDAKRQGLEDNKELQAELSHYRNQLADNYMSDKAVLDRLTKELYARMQEEVDVNHILIRLTPNPHQQMLDRTKSDLMAAKRAIEEGLPFRTVAKRYSQDRSVSSNGGHLGYRVAKLPDGFYDLETALYNTPVGEISDPVPSKLGYHIVQVLNRRPSRGEISVRQILARKSISGIRDTSEQKINRLYMELENGASFEELAKTYSEDQNTKMAGGFLGSFKAGTYAPEFEDAAFALEKDGDYSVPIETEYGWHIIQRVSLSKLGSFSDERRRLEKLVKEDSRFDLAQTALIEKIKGEENFDKKIFLNQNIQKILGPDVFNLAWKKPEIKEDFTMFTIADRNYKVSDFADYLETEKDLRFQSSMVRNDDQAMTQLVDAYINHSVFEYEKEHLEEKYPEFREIMREYREGIMLFEVSKNKIWDRVGSDSIGLRNYYNSHKDAYFADRDVQIGVFEIKTTDENVIKKVNKLIGKKTPAKVLKKYNKASNVLNYVEETQKEKSFVQIHGLEESEVEKGKTYVVKDEGTGKSIIAKVLEVGPRLPLSFEESKGAVMSDYQEYLEAEWIKDLKQKYEIVINKEVLQSMVHQ
ncbi:peptidylprolyl isomerase [Membranihabitans marinus]